MLSSDKRDPVTMVRNAYGLYNTIQGSTRDGRVDTQIADLLNDVLKSTGKPDVDVRFTPIVETARKEKPVVKTVRESKPIVAEAVCGDCELAERITTVKHECVRWCTVHGMQVGDNQKICEIKAKKRFKL